METLRKKRDELGEDWKFVEFLKQNKIPENYLLEYKGRKFLEQSQDAGDLDEQKLDLLKKICSFANTDGGLFVLGLEEDKTTSPPTPGEITGSNIKNFEKMLYSLIFAGAQPPCQFYLKSVSWPGHSNEQLYILDIPVSPIPVMLHWGGHSQCGTFPIRINEKTDYADRNQVENLFRRTEKGRHLAQSANIIFRMLQEILTSENETIATNEIYRLKHQFSGILPSLGFMGGEEFGFTIMDKYQITPNLVTLIGKHPEVRSNQYPALIDVFFKELTDYWREDLSIFIGLPPFGAISFAIVGNRPLFKLIMNKWNDFLKSPKEEVNYKLLEFILQQQEMYFYTYPFEYDVQIVSNVIATIQLLLDAPKTTIIYISGFYTTIGFMQRNADNRDADEGLERIRNYCKTLIRSHRIPSFIQDDHMSPQILDIIEHILEECKWKEEDIDLLRFFLSYEISRKQDGGIVFKLLKEYKIQYPIAFENFIFDFWFQTDDYGKAILSRRNF